MFNAGKKEFEVEIEDITGVTSGFLKNMTVSTTKGAETFVVNNKKEWIEAIQTAMSNKG